jgi:hypothetical protein
MLGVSRVFLANVGIVEEMIDDIMWIYGPWSSDQSSDRAKAQELDLPPINRPLLFLG